MEAEQFRQRLFVMRQEYLSQLPDKIQQIRDIWEDWLQSGQPHGTLTELRRLAHNLAGSGATFGCEEISAVAGRLEGLIGILLEQKITLAKPQLEQFNSILDTLDQALMQTRAATAPSTHSAAPSIAQGEESLIYLVEDDPHFAHVFTSRLEQPGYTVRVFTQGYELRCALDEARPAAIVMDMILPEGELAGAQITKTINTGEARPVPVVFVSIRDDIEARLQAVRAGATHYFTKPLNFDRLISTLGDLPGGRPRASYRVLHVDDDVALAEMYQAHMEQAGMTVMTLTNPLQAIDVIGQFKPDLILLDMYMPQCSGLELASIIRQYDIYALTPIVFMTAEWNLDKKLAALNLNSDDFLTKPVAPWHLVNTVIARIKRARVMRRGTTEMRSTLRELDSIKHAIDQHAIVSMTDAAGNITYVNDKFCAVSRFARQELLGQNHRLVKSGTHPQAVYDDLWSTISSGKVWQGELQNRTKDGSPYWVETTIVPFLDDFGVPQRYVSIRTEITSLKQAEAELRIGEERLRRSQIYANIGTWDWDIQSGGLFWSERIASLFGGPAGKLDTTYENFLSAAHPDDRQYVTDSVNACVGQGMPYNIEHRVVWPDGSEHWLHEQGDVTRDENGTPLHMLGVVQDITRRKQAEEALLLSQREAERANRAKSEFLSSMSHELRTPLNAILGFGQLLQADTANPLSQPQNEGVQQILKAGWHLLELINEVLDLAKIEAGKIDLSIENLDPTEVMRECADFISPLAQKRGIELTCQMDTAFVVPADRTRLKQALLNLLANAVKYNRDNGTIHCTIETIDGDKVRISVADTGVGLTPIQQAGLFQPFNRLGAEYTTVEGTGIGLALTRNLVELMGGNVGVESTPGQGSAFWIDLPAGVQAAPNDRQYDAGNLAALSKKQKTVLYVEDNPANLRLVAQIFAAYPEIRLITAHTAELGLEVARLQRPHLIILDINLPGMNGYELCGQLRLGETAGIPVAALSANALPRDIERGLAAGFVRYFTKPLQITEFVSAVRELLADNP